MRAAVLTRREAIVGSTLTLGGLVLMPLKVSSAVDEEISHSGEAIHQVVVFKAPRKRVYDVLTNSTQFDQVIKLSGAVKSGMALGNEPTQINPTPGGRFTIFRSHIIGRQIELAPYDRIVQAWRVVDWDSGIYSIAKFALAEQDAGTKLVFDHTGFPQGQAQHLADGWRANYWEPLSKLLA